MQVVSYFLLYSSLINKLESFIPRQAGLSMALGAFLAGLLLAETEFSLQVESDIAPYRGLLLGLFFMTVGVLCYLLNGNPRVYSFHWFESDHWF